MKTVKWWPRSKRIPKGWRIAAVQPSHHDRHSVLIERIGTTAILKAKVRG